MPSGLYKMPSSLDRMMKKKTASGVILRAAESLSFGADVNKVKKLLVTRAQEIGAKRMAGAVYDYALRMADDPDPMYEDVFKYFSLCRQLYEMEIVDFSDVPREIVDLQDIGMYSNLLRELTAKLVKENRLYRIVKDEDYPELYADRVK